MRKEVMNHIIGDYLSLKRKRSNQKEANKKLKTEMDGKYIGLSENQKLLVAAHIGIAPECEILIEGITDIDYIDTTMADASWNGATSLYLTVWEYLRDNDNKSEYEKIIRLLVKNGADPTTPCSYFGNKQETVEELIYRVANTENEKRKLFTLLEYRPEKNLICN